MPGRPTQPRTFHPPRDTRQRIQRASRFFARLEGFALECPACGKVYHVTPWRTSPYWEPRLARFSCRGKEGCQRKYVLGMVAWPMASVAKVATQTPKDQVPTPRQALQLRREQAGGHWLEDADAIRYERPETTNLTPEEGRPPQDEDELEDLELSLDQTGLEESKGYRQRMEPRKEPKG